MLCGQKKKKKKKEGKTERDQEQNGTDEEGDTSLTKGKGESVRLGVDSSTHLVVGR